MGLPGLSGNTERLQLCGEGSVALETFPSARAAVLRHLSWVDDGVFISLGSLVAFYAKTERKLSEDKGERHVPPLGGLHLPGDALFRVGQRAVQLSAHFDML